MGIPLPSIPGTYYPPIWEHAPRVISQPGYYIQPHYLQRQKAQPQNKSHIHTHDEPQSHLSNQQKLISAAKALGFGIIGYFIKDFPKLPFQPAKFMITADPRKWASIGFSIATVRSLNKALDWHPPAWLATIETLGVINTIALGFTKKAAWTTVLMAPILMGVVEATKLFADKVGEPLEDKTKIPGFLSKFAVSVGLMFLGIKMYPLFKRFVAQPKIVENWLSQAKVISKAEIDHWAKKPSWFKMSEEGSTLFGAEAAGCACCGSIICLNEIAGVASALMGHFHPKQNSAIGERA